MKCQKCQRKISVGSKYCMYCGEKVSTKDNENNRKDNRDGNLFGLWKQMDLYTKVLFIAFDIFIAGLIVSLAMDYYLAIMVSLVQITLIGLAFLLKKKQGNKPKPLLCVLILVMACMLSFFYIFGCMSPMNHMERLNWEELELGEYLPEPRRRFVTIQCNDEDYLSIYLFSQSKTTFKSYANACKKAGYTLDISSSDDFFTAFNEQGYRVTLYYNYMKKSVSVICDAPMEMGPLLWPEEGLAKSVPTPPSQTGIIIETGSETFTVYIGDVDHASFLAYIKELKSAGYTEEVQDYGDYFSARNKESNTVTVSYEGFQTMMIQVMAPKYNITFDIRCIANWIICKYDMDIYLDGQYFGQLDHGSAVTLSDYLKPGTHRIRFVSSSDDTIQGEWKFDVSEDETIELTVSCLLTEIIIHPESTEPYESEDSLGDIVASDNLGDEVETLTEHTENVLE